MVKKQIGKIAVDRRDKRERERERERAEKEEDYALVCYDLNVLVQKSYIAEDRNRERKEVKRKEGYYDSWNICYQRRPIK